MKKRKITRIAATVMLSTILTACPVISNQDLILVTELKSEITTTTASLLTTEDLVELETVIADASPDELLRLNKAVQSFADIVEEHYPEEASTRNVASRQSGLLSFGKALNETKDNLVAAFNGENFTDILSSYLDYGFGYNRELLTSAGASAGVSYAVAGGYVEFEAGTGAGYAFDFRNFTRYDYDAYFAGGSAGVTVGADATPISAAAEIAVIQVENLVFGLAHNQEYESSPSVGVGISVGVEGSIFAGFGFSVTGMYIEELESAWTLADLPTLPTGPSTNVRAISVASKGKTSAGVEIELMASLGLSGVVAYSDIIPGTFHTYIEGEEANRAEFTAAGFEMARDLLLAGDSIPTKRISWFAAANAILYGLFYVPENYESPTEPGGTNSTPPSEVTSLSATAGNRMVVLSWDDPANSDFAAVEISWSPNNPNPVIIGPGRERFSVLALENGIDYTFTIKTIDTSGNLSGGRTVVETPDSSAVIVDVVDMYSNDVSQYSLFLKNDGMLHATGNNSEGQLGTGNTSDRSTPVPVMADVRTASTGQKHSMIVKTNNTLWAVGDNTYGQFGDGTTTSKLTPAQVMTDVKKVEASWGHTLILKTDGSLWTTGRNFYGQLGHSGTTDVSTPAQVATNVADIYAGYMYSMFLKNDGTLWAMGSGGGGQFGDGTTGNAYTPKQIISDVSSVSAGGLHTLFVMTDGTLWASGWNDYGQLGDGTTTGRSTAVQIDNDVIEAGTGWFYSVYLKADGTVWAMGRNDQGQFGNGTTTDSTVPVQIFSNAARIAAGDSHTFVLLNDGTLWAAGQNFLGNLGDGSTSQRNSFVQITF